MFSYPSTVSNDFLCFSDCCYTSSTVLTLAFYGF